MLLSVADKFLVFIVCKYTLFIYNNKGFVSLIVFFTDKKNEELSVA